jgi:hypothetical protein
MARIYIHCGTYKTGSSAIQNTLWQHREFLLNEGWLYPETGIIKSEPEVGYRHTQLVWGFRNRSHWEVLVTKLINEINESNCLNVVISSEAWSNPVSISSLRELIRRLREAGHLSIQGILYIRNRTSYVRSLYREFTRRRGNSTPFQLFVDNHTGHLDYVRLVRSLNNVFLSELMVVSFENVIDVVHDFLDRIALPFIPEIVESKTNISVGAIETEIFRLHNLMNRHSKCTFPSAPKLFYCYGIEFSNLRKWTEVISLDVLKCDLEWKSQLADISGLSLAEVDALSVLPATDDKLDVGLLTPLLAELLKRWLEEQANLKVVVQNIRSSIIEESKFDLGAEFTYFVGMDIGGVAILLPHLEAKGNLLFTDANGERKVIWSLSSPRYAVKYPLNRYASKARFKISGVVVDKGQSAALDWVSSDGKRFPVAVLNFF